MKRTAKIWLIIAGVLVVLGPVLIVGALAGVGFDVEKLGGETFKTATYDVGATFDEIAVDIDGIDVSFAPAQDDACKVVCTASEHQTNTVDVEDGTLRIRSAGTQAWYEQVLHFSFREPCMTVYLPQAAYDTLTVRSDTGDLSIPGGFSFGEIKIDGNDGDFSCAAAVNGDVDIRLDSGNVKLNNAVCEGNVIVQTDTGNVKLKGLTCAGINVESSTGNVELVDTLAKNGSFRIRNSTGNVQFKGSDAQEITVETDTGNVTGSLLSEKIFITQSSTGNISVPPSTKGGKCEITTSTGNIELKIE